MRLAMKPRKEPPLPGPSSADEKERLKELQRYEILDTAPEREFDGITLLASHICGTRMGLTSRPAKFLRRQVQSDKSIAEEPPSSLPSQAHSSSALGSRTSCAGHRCKWSSGTNLMRMPQPAYVVSIRPNSSVLKSFIIVSGHSKPGHGRYNQGAFAGLGISTHSQLCSWRPRRKLKKGNRIIL